MATLPDGLLEAAKNYLDITWDDPASDKKLAGILMRGMSSLDGIAGEKLDYAAEDKPRELLLEYALYVRSNALDDYHQNFARELLGLQISKEVERADATSEQ